MVIKTVFMDFDGTVSDAKEIAFKSIVKTLREFGYEFSEKKLMDLLGVKMEIMLKDLGLDVGNVEKIRKKFYKHFIAAVDDGIRPCVSLRPLWEFKEEGLPLIVISNSRGEFLRASIEELKIEGLFSGVYGSENFDSKDLMLKSLFLKMKIKPSEAVYVGDRFSDIQFAKKAGCVSVAISNKCSFSTPARLKREKPDFVVRDFRGLRRIVREINS